MASTDATETEDIDVDEDDDDLSGIGDLEGFEIVDEVEGDDEPMDQDNENRTSEQIAETIDDEQLAESAVQKSLPQLQLSEINSSVGTEGSDSDGTMTSEGLKTMVESGVSTPVSPYVEKKTTPVTKATPKTVKKTPVVVKKTTVVIKRKKGTPAANPSQGTKGSVAAVKKTVGGRATPKCVKSSPTAVDTTPASARVTPTTSKATPAAVKTTPAGTKTTPAGAKATPVAAKTATAIVKTTPAALKTTPGVKTKPAAVKTTPAVAKTTPAVAKKPPATVKTTPAAANTTPVAAKTTSVAVKTTPGTVKTTPAAVKTKSGTVKTTPAAVKTTPTTAKTTPTAVETTTTVKTTPLPTKTATAAKTPATLKTTPRLVKTAPTPIKTPSVLKTTPAGVKTTPILVKTTSTPIKTPSVAKTTPAGVKITPTSLNTTPVPTKTAASPANAKTTPPSVNQTPRAVKVSKAAKATLSTAKTPSAPGNVTSGAAKTASVAAKIIPKAVKKTHTAGNGTPTVAKTPGTAKTSPAEVRTTPMAEKNTPEAVKTVPEKSTPASKAIPAAPETTPETHSMSVEGMNMTHVAVKATSAVTEAAEEKSCDTGEASPEDMVTNLTAVETSPVSRKTTAKETEATSVDTKAAIIASKAHPAIAKTTPTVTKKIPIVAKKTPIAAKKTLIAAKKTPIGGKKNLLILKTTSVTTAQTVSRPPSTMKTSTAAPREAAVDSAIIPAAVKSVTAYTTLVTTKPSPVPSKTTTVAAKIPPTTAIPSATSTTTAGANTAVEEATFLSDPTGSKDTNAVESIIPAEANASAEVKSVSDDDTTSGSVEVVEQSTNVKPSVAKSTKLGATEVTVPPNVSASVSKAMSGAISAVTKRVTVALTKLTPAVIRANLAVKGTDSPTQKHIPVAAKQTQSSIVPAPSSSTYPTSLSEDSEPIDNLKTPLQTPVSEESNSLEKPPKSDEAEPKSVPLKKGLKPGTNTLSVKSQSTGDLSAKADSTAMQKTISSQSVPSAVSKPSPVRKPVAVKKTFAKPTTVLVKVMKGTEQSQPSSVGVVPDAQKPSEKAPVAKSCQKTTVKTSPVMKSPGSKTMVTKRKIQKQSRETMTDNEQGHPISTQTPQHMLHTSASEREDETTAARWVAERVAGKQERQLINRLKTVMLHPVQVDDLADPALQPFILNCHCLSARFLSSRKGVQKKGHLEIRYFTEADAIKYVNDMKGLKLASGKYLTAKILGQCGPWDGTLDEWQRKNITQQEGLAEARCVFVHNLPAETQEDMLRLLYPEAVNISLHLPKEDDKKSTGHAVLEFLTPEEAEVVTSNSKKYETKIGGNTVTLTLIVKRSLKPEGESTSEKSPVKTAEKQGGKRTIDGNDETPSVSPKKKAKSAKGKDEVRYKGADIRQFLLHWCYAQYMVPQYSFKSWGPSHRLRFKCEAKVAEVDFVARGTGTSKKNAQYKCAYDFVKYLVKQGKLKESSIKKCEEELINLGLIPAPIQARVKDKPHLDDNSHKHAPGPSKTLEKSDREEKDSTRGRSVEKRRSREAERRSREPKGQSNSAERTSQHPPRATRSLNPPRIRKEDTVEEDLNIQALKSEITKQLAELQEGRVSDPDKLTELAEKLQSASEAKQKGQYGPAEKHEQYTVPVEVKVDSSKDTCDYKAERKDYVLVEKSDKSDKKRDGVDQRRDTNVQRRDTPDQRRDIQEQRRERVEHRRDTPDQRQDTTGNRRDALVWKRDIPDRRRDTPESRRDAVEHRRDTLGHRRDASDERRDSQDQRRDISDYSKPASDRRRHTPERNRDSSDRSRHMPERKTSTPEKKNELIRKGDMGGKNWVYDKNKEVSDTGTSDRKRRTQSREKNSPERKGDEYYDPFAMTKIKKARVESPTRESREMSHLLHLADMVRQNFGQELAQKNIPQPVGAMNQQDFKRATVQSLFPAQVASYDQQDFNSGVAQTNFPQQGPLLVQQDFDQNIHQNTFPDHRANMYQVELNTNIAHGTSVGQAEFSRSLGRDPITQQVSQHTLSETVAQHTFSQQLLSIGQEKHMNLSQSTVPQQLPSLNQERFNRDLSQDTIPVQMRSMGQQHFNRDIPQSNFPSQMTVLGQQDLPRDVADSTFSQHISTIGQQTLSREVVPSTFSQQTTSVIPNTISQRMEPSRQQYFTGRSESRIGDQINSAREPEFARHHSRNVQRMEVLGGQNFMRSSSQSTASQHVSSVSQQSYPASGVSVTSHGVYSDCGSGLPHTASAAGQSCSVSEGMPPSPWPLRHQTQSEKAPFLEAGPEVLKAQLINRLRQFQDGQLTDNSNILTQLAQQLLNVQRQEELGQADLSSQQANVSRAGMSTNETANSRTQVQMTTTGEAHAQQSSGPKVDHSIIRENLLLKLQTAGITSGTINSLVKGLKTVQQEEKQSTSDSYSMCAADKSNYTCAIQTESKSSKISRNVKPTTFDAAKMKVQEQMKEKIQQIKQNQMALKMARKRALATQPFTFVPGRTAENPPRGILKKTEPPSETLTSECAWTAESTSYPQTRTLESRLQALTQQCGRNTMNQRGNSGTPEFKVPLSAVQRGRTRSEPGRNFAGPIVTSRTVGERTGSPGAGTQMPFNYGNKRRSANSGRNSSFLSSLVDYPESP